MRGPIPGFRWHVATVAICAAAFVAMALWLLNVGGALHLQSAYRVHALVPSAQSVASGAQVTMAGAAVGKVIEVKRQGLGAVLTLQITDERVTPLRSDATAQVRARTPVGENYVALAPGRSSASLRDGGQLRMASGEGFVDIDRLLSVLQGRTRQRARMLLAGTGRALEDRGPQLNRLVGGTAGSFTEGAKVVHTLVDEREDVGRLVDELGAVARAVGERQQAVEVTARRGLVAFRALATRDRALAKVLRTLRPTLGQVRDTSELLRSTALTAAPVVGNLAVATRQVRPAVRRLNAAATEGGRVVRQLDAAGTPLRRILARVRKLASPAAGALPPLRRTLCQINPMLRYAKPYTPDVIQAIIGLGSAANAYDAIGHTIRLMPIVHDNSLVGLPDSVSKAARTLVHAGVLGESTALDYQPFMKPGDLGRVKATGKGVVGPDGARESGFKYPRTHADC